MWMYVVCVGVNEQGGKVAGVRSRRSLGTGGSGSAGQGAPATFTGIPRPGAALVQSPCHSEGKSSGGQECSHTNTQTGLRQHAKPTQ